MGGPADLAAILAQVEALERAHGLPPGGVLGGASGKGGGPLGGLLMVLLLPSYSSVRGLSPRRLPLCRFQRWGRIPRQCQGLGRNWCLLGLSSTRVAVWVCQVSIFLCRAWVGGPGDPGARPLLPVPLGLALFRCRVWVGVPRFLQGIRGWGESAWGFPRNFLRPRVLPLLLPC